jgi:hypothetical protein
MDNIKEQGFEAIGITDRDELLYRRKVQPPMPVQHPWVGLTDKEVVSIEECALTKRMAIAMTSATLKEKNT